jgi:PAS domain S-box-containing protein
MTGLSKYKSTLLKLLAFLVILTIGIIYIIFNKSRIEESQTEYIMQNARSIGASLSVDDIKALDGVAEDVDKPQYSKIKSILKRAKQVNASSKFAYIYILRDNKIYFLADNESEDSPDYSPPGQEYTDAIPSDKQPFIDGKEAFSQEQKDKWGTWRSALIPIKDEITGKTIAVFGMDFNAQSWKNYILFEVIESSLLVIVLLLIVLFAFSIYNKHRTLKQQIAERNKAENITQDIIEKNPISIHIVDKKGITIKVNPAYTKLFGTESKSSDSVFDLIQKVKPQLAELLALARTGEVVRLPELQYNIRELFPEVKDNFLWLRIIIFPLKDIQGNPEMYVLMHENITERKKDEEDLLKAKEKAEENDRLKTAFLANMSHEIRTPMNGIMGFTELLKEPGLTGEQQQEFIGIIEKSGERMLNIINDIFCISKVEAGAMTISSVETNVNEQLKNLFKFLKPEADYKGISLSYKYSLTSEKSVIMTDSEKFYAVFVNLIKNALKFTDKGTIEFGYQLKPSLRTADKSIDKPFELEFFVKDSGIGIMKEKIDIVFERFRQASEGDARHFEGAGLGLSISKAYIEMLGGRIWVESELGKGSVFYFTLPYNNEPVEKVSFVVPSENEDEKIKNLKIMIAEDDKFSERLFNMAVRKYSREIINVDNGLDAVEICRKNPDIDLILMDILMPVMNGYDAVKYIREFNKDVVIIAQTAFVLTSDRNKAIEAGCNDFITKPINNVLFAELMKKYFLK